MLWLVAALITSFSRAGMRLSNQYFQLQGIQLVITTKLLLALCIVPILFFIPWPSQPLFYLYLVIQAPFIVYQDIKVFDLTAQHGAGVVTRIEPLNMVLTFFVWLAITPALFASHLHDPSIFLGVVATLLFIVFCSIHIRNCPINMAVLKQMLPLIFISTIVTILAKLSIDQAEHDSAIFILIFIQSIFILILGLFSNQKMKTITIEELFDRTKIWFCIIVTLIMSISAFGRIYAFRYVDNPAYVSAIILLAPFWVILFYKLTKHKEQANIFPGIGIVCGVIALTLLTAL